MKRQIILMNGFEFEEQSHYIVEASMTHGNPIFQDIFYTGFLNDKNNAPGGYNQLLQTNTEYKDIYFMRIIRKVDTTIDNQHKMVKAVLLKDYPEYVL